MLQGRTSGRGRMARLGGLLALAMFLAFPAAAAPTKSAVSADGRTLTLAPGERVVARLGADGRLTLVSAGSAPASAALPPKPGQGSLEPSAPGALVFLLGVEGGKSTLKIDSGLDQAVDYRANLRREAGAADEAARACTLLPLLASWEQWPYAVSRLTLSGFAAKPTNEVVCSGPEAQQETIP
jgi:hypothetical protein